MAIIKTQFTLRLGLESHAKLKKIAQAESGAAIFCLTNPATDWPPSLAKFFAEAAKWNR